MTKITYVGDGVYRERRYIKREPMVGDKIEVIDKNIDASFRGYGYGSEGIVTRTTTYFGDGIFASMSRSNNPTSCILDGEYAVYEDIYRTLSHEEVEVKRFLGIPYRKKITKIWREDVIFD